MAHTTFIKSPVQRPGPSNRSVCVYGPQGSGKTMHAQAIATHFGLTRVIDEWYPGEPFPTTGALVLADERPCSPPWERRVISIEDALRLINTPKEPQ